MQFGLYGTNGHVTVGSPEIAQAVLEASGPLPHGRQDKQFEFGLDMMLTAEKAGFDIILFAERHLGPDLTTWVVAGAIGSRLERMRSMVAVHPGLWHPALIAKLSMTLDRICKGGMAINLVTGASESEFQMFGGTALLDDADKRYVRATEFINFIKSAWTQDRFSMKGEFFPTDNFELRLRPRNEADMRSRMKAVGRHIRFGFNPFVGFGENTQSALDASIARIIAHERNPDTAKIQRSMLPATLGGCMGKPEDIRRQIGRFRDMGIELILFKMTAGIDDVRRIGSEIIAPFRSGST